MKMFVDSWGWLALEDKKDSRHSEAERYYRQRAVAPGRIITSDYVLDETITLLFRRRPFAEGWRYLEGIFQSVDRGFTVIERVTEKRFRRAVELRRRFSDKRRISFTDLCSMAMMHELGVSEVLTADADFRQVGLGFQTFPE